MTAPVDVLSVLDGAAEKIRFLAEKAGISHPATDLVEARAAVAELIEAAKAVSDENMGVAGATKYYGEDDEIGTRVCCGVLSYESHAADCEVVRLRAALARVQGDAAQQAEQVRS